MEPWLTAFVGIGLAAACGFRVFVPLLMSSIAARADYLPLASSFEWLDSDAALICLSVATLAELGGYFVPWVDNLLDSIASPAAVVAGSVLAAAVMIDVDPWLRWSLAIVAGGGAAGIIQTGTVATRATSSATTGGLGNPLVAMVEFGGSVVTSIMAIVLPVVTVALVSLLVMWAGSKVMRRAKGTKRGDCTERGAEGLREAD